MSGKRNAPFINVGISSLLVVFLVLSLAIFAALSLASANSDVSYSRRMADRKTDYYAACSRAERILDAVDERLAETGFGADFSDLGVTREGDYLSWQTALSDTQAISVRLILTPEGQHYYEITQWKTVAAEQPPVEGGK